MSSSKTCRVVFLVISIFQVVIATDREPYYPTGDQRNCRTTSPQVATQPLYPMDVLPGLGYDALRDIDMGQVLDYNYSSCRVSKDGRYLLPNNVYLSPLRQSSIQVYADYFDHWNKYTSLTSKTINAHASIGWGFAKIGGSYSSEYTTTKSHMANDDSKVVRIHLRDILYSVQAEPRSPLHSRFKSRLFEIAAYLQKNMTDHAHYLAELLIRDYGTHYLTSIEAGAIISQTDFVRSDYIEDKSSDSAKVKASASASFFGKISVGGGFSTTTNHTYDEGYMNNRTFSKVDTIGGPPFRIGFTINQWEDGIPDALVPIDRAGDPLHFVINSDTLPELPYMTRGAVADIVYDAIKRYIRVNTHKGCTNPKSKHFDFNANVDDSSCDTETVYSNYTFGGTYQTCVSRDPSLCAKYSVINQPNPLTHGYSCPDDINYLPVKMFSGTIDVRFWWFLWFWRETVMYETYWCVARPGTEIPARSGFLFGGFYTVSTPNPITNTMGCPPYFVPLKIGNYLSVCVSTEFELGFRYSIPFGGFETCISGNPLSKNTFSEDPNSWPHECPHGYTRYFGGVEHGCDINICVKTGTLKLNTYGSLLPPRLPPFHVHRPKELNDTESLTFLGSDGRVWTRNWVGEWSNAEPTAASQCFVDRSTTQQEVDTSPSETSTFSTSEQTTFAGDITQKETTADNVPLKGSGSPSTAAVTIPTILIIVLIVCIIVFVMLFFAYRAFKRRQGYNNIHHTSNGQPSDLNTPA